VVTVVPQVDRDQLGVLLLTRACIAAKVSAWHASKVIERAGSPWPVFEGDFEPLNQWELQVVTAAHQFPDRQAEEAKLEHEAKGWLEQGLRITTVLDDDYPLNLRFIWDRPPFLLYRGELSRSDAYALAVVGTRNPSEEGVRRASKLATLLVDAGVTVLSGLARGIDTAAHRATLAAGGRTIAVLGSGLERIYPKENTELAEEVAEHGALVSQFFPQTPPTRGTFPLRNTVTSGLGQGTIVVEATHTSGARLQARLAIEHGKHAFLLKSLVEQYEWAEQFARKPRVVVITDVEEVLSYLTPAEDLDAHWRREADAIREATAEPPEFVQQRLAHKRDADQTQLPL
jgi:DNA processing protein